MNERHPNRRGKEKRKTNKHHITNKCEHVRGQDRQENLLRVDIEKHNFIHRIFGNLNFYDIVVLILRVCRAKHYERIEPRIKQFYELL